MNTTSTLTDRIRKIDVRDPETFDIFELRATIEKPINDRELPEVDLERLDVFGLRDLVKKLDLPEIDLPEFDIRDVTREDVEELVDRFDLLGVRKAFADADRVEFTRPSSPGDVVSQLDDVRASFEGIVKNLVDNANDLAPVTRKEFAELEQRVIKAEKAAKKKAPARKRTTKKAAAKKA